MPALPWITIAAVATTASAGVSAYKTLTAKPPEMPKIPGARGVEAPAVDDHDAERAARQRQKLMRLSASRPGQSDTLRTSPRGLTGGAPLEYKTLLGS